MVIMGIFSSQYAENSSQYAVSIRRSVCAEASVCPLVHMSVHEYVRLIKRW